RYMVHNHIRACRKLKAIVGVAAIVAAVAGAKMKVAEDHVAGFDVHRVILCTDAVTGGGLTRDSEIGLVDFEGAGQLNHSSDIENDRARAGGVLDAVAQ